ncbi:MAG: hypothetical protein LUC95_07305 [Lachnospiraceae bacterium]|nr:hypothetical protein [Lachnospiraceae bacterium]
MAKKDGQKDRQIKRQSGREAASLPEGIAEMEPQNAEHEKMLEWLKSVKFKRTLVGGVDEADVWKKLDELNALYEAALIAERVRYDLQLEEYAAEASEKVAKYRRTLKALKAEYDKLAARVQQSGGEGRRDG